MSASCTPHKRNKVRFDRYVFLTTGKSPWLAPTSQHAKSFLAFTRSGLAAWQETTMSLRSSLRLANKKCLLIYLFALLAS